MNQIAGRLNALGLILAPGANKLLGMSDQATSPPGEGPLTERPRTGLVIATVAFAMAVAFVILTFFDPTYRSFDGIVGQPAFLDYSPAAKVWCYLLVVAAPVAAAWAAARASDRSPLGLTAALWAIALVFTGAGLFRLPDETMESLMDAFPRGRSLWHMGFLAVLISALSFPGRGAGPNGTPATRIDSPWAIGPLSVWLVLALHCYVILAPWIESLETVLVAAILISAAFVWSIGRPKGSPPRTPPPRASSPWTLFERTAWIAFGSAAVLGPLARLGRTLDWDWFSSAAGLVLTASIIAITLGMAMRGRGSDRPIQISPLVILPFTLIGLYRGAGTDLFDYDAFHQGEYVYAAYAFEHGLAPFRDLFFVHGLGFNTFGGWLFGDRVREFPVLDIFALDIISTAGAGLMLWIYLKLWGPRWWPAALALAFATCGVLGTKSARFAPLYLTLLAVIFALTSARPRLWLAIAGGLAAAGTLFSLDTGFVALLSGALFAAALPWLAPTVAEPFGATFRARCFAPIASFSGGAALVGGVIALWLAGLGVLDDALGLTWDYARVKAHYDNLPLPDRGLVLLFCPAITIVAAVALAIRRRADHDASSAIVLFLTFANFLLFMRALDRSDVGHLIYASQMAWPLAGCLIVQRAGGPEARVSWGRSIGLILLLALVARLEPGLGADYPMALDAPQVARWHAQNRSRPAALPLAAMKQEFFEFAGAVKEATEPGDTLYDMTDRPAVYYWAERLCPSRFYALFYASPGRWQREIIESLKEDQTPWVIWPPYAGLTIDGIDTQLRHWDIAAYVLENYSLDRELPDGSLLLGRSDQSSADEPWRFGSVRSIDLGAVPKLWGRNPEGTPAQASETLWEGSATFATDDQADLDLSARGAQDSIAGASELQIEFAAPVDGFAQINLFDKAGKRQANFRLDLDPGFLGPYRIRLESFARWVKADPPEALRISIEPPTPASARVRFAD